MALHHVFAIEYPFALLESLGLMAPLVISTKVSLAAMGFFRPSNYQSLTILLVAAVLSFFTLGIQHFIIQPIYNEHLSASFIQLGGWFHFLICFIVNASALTVSLFWNTLQDQTAYISRRKEAEQLNREAELLMLRHQLQPHFLFNSLNSINALIGFQPKKAREMIQQLGSFLRGTIKIDDQQPIVFEKELEQIELYLNIEKVRFGHRLEVEIDASEEVKTKKIPPLLLQPLLENAIKFGLYGTTEKVILHLNAHFEHNWLVISISNPIDQDADSQEGTGFGLESVQRRLHLMYGRADLITAEKTAHLFTVQLKIPQ